MYSVGFYTLGCKVSQYETEAVAELFEENGFLRSPFENANDVYVINTCTVTAEGDRKCRQLIRRAIKKNPEAIVIGSIFERDSELLWNSMQQQIEREALSFSANACKILPAELGDSIGDFAAVAAIFM